MSFLDTGKKYSDWHQPPSRASLRIELGCAQCGSRLEMKANGKYHESGKCLNCTGFVSDEDEDFDDFED